MLSAVVAVMLCANTSVFAVCTPCQMAAAIKQSIKDAQAAALAAAAKPSKVAHELELDEVEVTEENVRCGCEIELIRLSLVEAAATALSAAAAMVDAVEPDEVPADDQARAAREELADPVCCGQNGDASLQSIFNCCVNTNQQVKCQGAAAEKCCHQLRHRIHTVKELVEDQIDQSSVCCSLMESLLVSQMDASAVCCSTIEAQINNLNLSVAEVFTLLMSVWDCTCT